MAPGRGRRSADSDSATIRLPTSKAIGGTALAPQPNPGCPRPSPRGAGLRRRWQSGSGRGSGPQGQLTLDRTPIGEVHVGDLTTHIAEPPRLEFRRTLPAGPPPRVQVGSRERRSISSTERGDEAARGGDQEEPVEHEHTGRPDCGLVALQEEVVGVRAPARRRKRQRMASPRLALGCPTTCAPSAARRSAILAVLARCATDRTLDLTLSSLRATRRDSAPPNVRQDGWLNCTGPLASAELDGRLEPAATWLPRELVAGSG